MNNHQTRRDFFARTSDGLLGAALTHLLCHDFFGGTSALAAAPETDSPAQAQTFNLRPKQTHHPAKATAVIQLFMNGGPSQMDLFDEKPKLAELSGKSYPGKQKVETLSPSASGNLLGSPYKFTPAGQCGMWLSEVIPHMAGIADDICLVRSMTTEPVCHETVCVCMRGCVCVPVSV